MTTENAFTFREVWQQIILKELQIDHFLALSMCQMIEAIEVGGMSGKKCHCKLYCTVCVRVELVISVYTRV